MTILILILELLLMPARSLAAEPPACARTVSADKPFTLRQNECVLVAKKLTIRFLTVKEDSRCPDDVTCVLAGNARAIFSIEAHGLAPSKIKLDTTSRGLEPDMATAAVFSGYRITLVKLAPSPKSREVIPPGSYIATLSVSKNK